MGVVKEIKHENKLGLLREKASYADVVRAVILKPECARCNDFSRCP
jgi:hypothetical protein